MVDGSILAAVTTGSPTTPEGHRHSSETPTSESTRPRSAIISVALGKSEQMRTTPETSAGSPRSLCESCTFVRHVQGRLGQRYLLCENPEIAAKYPPQPVR